MNCAICGQPLKQIPAGVSKTTGKSYNSFWACNDRTHKQPRVGQVTPQQPIYQNQAYKAPQAQIYAKSPIVEPDWDKISWGKCKHTFLVEAYKRWLSKVDGQTTISEIEKEAERWADMSMRKLSKTPAQELGIDTDSINLNEPDYGGRETY